MSTIISVICKLWLGTLNLLLIMELRLPVLLMSWSTSTPSNLLLQMPCTMSLKVWQRKKSHSSYHTLWQLNSSPWLSSTTSLIHSLMGMFSIFVRPCHHLTKPIRWNWVCLKWLMQVLYHQRFHVLLSLPFSCGLCEFSFRIWRLFHAATDPIPCHRMVHTYRKSDAMF